MESPDFRATGEVFDADAFEKNVPDGIENHYWHQARNRVIRRTLAGIPGAREQPILEVGCGRGVVVTFLRRHGWNVTGCELGNPAPIVADVAPYLVMGQPSSALPRSLRDTIKTILLCDVLEHIADPAAFLREHVDNFPACSHFLVTLPARQELYSNYDRFYRHYLRYDIGSLRQLCGAAGLALEEHRYFFHLLYAPTLLMSALGIKRSVQPHAPAHAMRLLHRTIGWCLAGEPRLIPGAVPGTSLIGVLKVGDRAG